MRLGFTSPADLTYQFVTSRKGLATLFGNLYIAWTRNSDLRSSLEENPPFFESSEGVSMCEEIMEHRHLIIVHYVSEVEAMFVLPSLRCPALHRVVLRCDMSCLKRASDVFDSRANLSVSLSTIFLRLSPEDMTAERVSAVRFLSKDEQSFQRATSPLRTLGSIRQTAD